MQQSEVTWEHRVQHMLQNIIFRVGQAACKVNLPCRHFHLPRHSVKQRLDMTLPKKLLAEQGKSGFCSACPIAVFCQNHLQLATGPVVMLHAGTRTNQGSRIDYITEKPYLHHQLGVPSQVTWEHRVQHMLQNIIFRVGQAACKVNLPCRHFHLPRHSVKQRLDMTLPKKLLAEQGKSGFCSACPIAVFCQNHLQLATGPVVMLHAGTRTNQGSRIDYITEKPYLHHQLGVPRASI